MVGERVVVIMLTRIHGLGDSSAGTLRHENTRRTPKMILDRLVDRFICLNVESAPRIDHTHAQEEGTQEEGTSPIKGSFHGGHRM